MKIVLLFSGKPGAQWLCCTEKYATSVWLGISLLCWRPSSSHLSLHCSHLEKHVVETLAAGGWCPIVHLLSVFDSTSAPPPVWTSLAFTNISGSCDFFVKLHQNVCRHNILVIFNNVMLFYDTRCYFNVHSKANMSQLNLLHDLSQIWELSKFAP